MGGPTINQQSDDVTEDFNRRIGNRLATVFATEQGRLRSEGIPVVSVALGANLPNAPLLDRDGAQTWLYDALGPGTSALVFFRGAWCPYCNLTLAHYQKELLPRLHERGVGLVAVSPQTQSASNDSIADGSLEFTVLTDPANYLVTALGILTEPSAAVRAAQADLGFDIADSNADATGGIPYPTVLVIDAERIVRFADVQMDYTQRTEVSEILAAVDSID
jgi:peroxiredoxin